MEDKCIILFSICLKYIRVEGFEQLRRKVPGGGRSVRREGARSLQRNRLWLEGLQMLFQGRVAGSAASGPVVDAADGG